MREREISLLDLFTEILLHWRGVLIAMLLGGILAGGASAVRSWRGQATDTEVLQPWAALDEAQRTKVHIVVKLQEQYEAALDDWQKSAMIRLDPQHILREELTLAVRAESYQRAYAAAVVYGGLLDDVSLYRYVEEHCGIESSVDGLITSGGGVQGVQNVGDVEGTGEEQMTIVVGQVQILYDDADLCSAMADAAVEFLRQHTGELEEALGRHELVVLIRSQGKNQGSSIALLSNNSANLISQLEFQTAERLRALTEEEKAYYEYLLARDEAGQKESGTGQQGNSVGVKPDGVEQEAVAPEGEGSLPSGISVKYVLLGAVLATFVYVFAVFLKYIMDGRLRGTDGFLELYGIPHLGTVSAGKHKKRFLGVVDQWIRSLRCYNQRIFAWEEAAGLAAAAVRMAALKKGADTVCVLGCGLKGNALAVCGQVKEQLEAAGIRVEILNNVLYDVREMARLEGIGSAVLVETAGTTLYGEVCRELELLQRQEILVLGGIVVE